MTLVQVGFFTTALALLAAAIVPLVDKRFSYPDGIPPQVDRDPSGRGPQTGYNRCNATVEGHDSLCQTAFINSVDDFCIWAPPNPNSLIGATEGEAVAWCTKPGRGTRLIPDRALLGVQFTTTPDYIQVVGYIDQVKINIAPEDDGGEMDPHGADLRGNPLGGLLYSNAFGNDKNSFTQVIEWHNFMGSNFFCMKACNPTGRFAAQYCQHIYDRIGCAYNAPNEAQLGVYESCQGENQDFPGLYVDTAGVTRAYTQRPESLGSITSMPYTARVPKSSNCVQYASSELYVKASASVGQIGGEAPTPSRNGVGSSANGGFPEITSTGLM